MALTQVTGGLIASGQTITTPTISGYINLATWTTGTRPGSPVTGTQGFNTTLGVIEAYNGSAWVSGGGLNLQAVQTSGFTATAGNSYPCNTTSAAFTVTLPASPVAGNQVGLFDYAGTFATNNLTLGRNGSNITGQAINYILNTNRESIILTYVDSTQGWIVSSAAYTTLPITLPPYTVSYLIVAGGGGGGYGDGAGGMGGGGAGGLLSGTLTVTPNTVYTATVGAGGSGGTYPAFSPSTNGSNSSFTGLTAGVGGGAGNSANVGGTGAGSSGGSGGGGSGNTGAGGAGGSGTPGQGNTGGQGGSNPSGTGYKGGGGGGASAVGVSYLTPATTSGCAGGAGTASSITGTPVTYAGGGGSGVIWAGYTSPMTGGAGGAGGGGAGGDSSGTPANTTTSGTAGTANTGGGGGGAAYRAPFGGNGGSGVVILSVPTVNYTGTVTGSPTVTTSGSNTIIKWTTAGSGTYTA